jgi:hypothetical protein
MVGVLLAGASALGANMGILSTSDGIGEVTAVSNTVASSTTVTTEQATTTTTAPAADLVAYQINGVGVVTVAREGNKLFVDSVDVGSWAYTVASQGKELSMEFDDGDRTISFKAAVKKGEVLVEVWEDDVIVQSGGSSSGGSGSTAATTPPATTATTAPSTTSSTYGDDDSYDDDGDDQYEDDDDHYEDDEYDDNYEDDEYEGRHDDD